MTEMSFKVRNAISSTPDLSGNAVNIEWTEDGRVAFEVQAADGTIMRAFVTDAQARSLAQWVLRGRA
jgi:hypothetical protein